VTVIACPPSTPPVTGVVVFVPATFIELFPEFATVAPAVLSFNFDLATLILNNSCCSRVQDANKRETLLNLLTAHITLLRNGANGQAPSGIVGRIDSATEGSVSVSAELASTIPFTAAYFAQTQYGLMFWQATAPWRQFVYVAPPPVCADLEPGAGLGGYPYGIGDGCGC
jgi:hypothetical protein